ncbi:hypothetical protein TNCT_201101 [Trichonephila clavata]|uniref:Uncharacterized protein n=1 Tax=Trichonephila clavata TaxID=2740835 RepID=A0A8X6IDD8_TRICU|nr:hypothetical protein TNCT_201101 [Trichonephila clavata]
MVTVVNLWLAVMNCGFEHKNENPSYQGIDAQIPEVLPCICEVQICVMYKFEEGVSAHLTDVQFFEVRISGLASIKIKSNWI